MFMKIVRGTFYKQRNIFQLVVIMSWNISTWYRDLFVFEKIIELEKSVVVTQRRFPLRNYAMNRSLFQRTKSHDVY